ncbi:hypothetical protein FGIG_03304 [Fasciola gigantica]|uniref:Uncharacterized protein n=1 Tax=Fasciola gigantica TaxID=46835 RepID=A0A504Z6N0_FASGI|nr:hypothetical protein FGIG_03304 [Fasciola gigantica]
MSVAYDLHQLPPQSAFVVPPHHFGGSMPMLVDPHECCAAHTANPHNTRLDARQQSRARPSKSMQPPSEFADHHHPNQPSLPNRIWLAPAGHVVGAVVYRSHIQIPSDVRLCRI